MAQKFAAHLWTMDFCHARGAPCRSIPILLFAGDRAERAHVHVDRDANRAKVWLDPVRLQDSGGFLSGALARVVVREHETVLLKSWDDDFAD